MGKKAVIATILMALSVVGCNRSVSALAPSPPQPLPSVPSGDLQVTQLDPISGEQTQLNNQNGQFDPNAPQTLQPIDGNPNTSSAQTGIDGQNSQTDIASLAPQGGKPLEHETVLGSWQVLTDNSDCKVFLAFTQWSGGYRAGSRRCQSAEVGSVTAWDIKGQQVVLVDANGNTVARLYSSGNDRYDGQTTSGKPISFSRDN